MSGWLSDEERRRDAGAYNRERIVRDFSWRASAKRLLSVYEMALSSRQRAGAA
jgi:glycosyltransferase involved in cell wall biosynthesis